MPQKYSYELQATRLNAVLNTLKEAHRKMQEAASYERRHAADTTGDYVLLAGDINELLGRIDDYHQSVLAMVDLSK